MNPDYTYVALLDVLSYRSRLDADQKSGRFDFKDDLTNALSVLTGINSTKFVINAISDTIIITCSTHENFPEFLGVLRSIFLAFMTRQLFIRGGVSYSKHFQSGMLTYSHAVARSYELESKQAIYPRIVIDDNILQMYKPSSALPDIFGKGFFHSQNGISFLNLVEASNWKNVYDLAEAMYKKDKPTMTGNESAFSKHLWFQNYLFSFDFADDTQPKYIDGITSF